MMCKLWQRPTGSRDLEQATALAPVLLLPGPGCLVKGDLIIIILHLPERRDYRNSYGPTCSLIIYFLIVKSNLKNFFAQFYSCFRDDAHFLHGEAAYFSLERSLYEDHCQSRQSTGCSLDPCTFLISYSSFLGYWKV